jgi:sterol desaturase/sphingolipid hydroxylase (fatty acid hydroxylase superfamily)
MIPYIYNILISTFKGLLLSGSVFGISFILDNTISKSYKDSLLLENKQLVKEGYRTTSINLLIISPIVYGIVNTFILCQDCSFSLHKFICLLIIQNIGYFWTHREMHINNRLRWMHKFHHKFQYITLPSTSNAVSPHEFCIAYISPIIIGAIILRPSELTFASSIGLISIFNICIHIPNLKNIPWIPRMVSPTQHAIHHLKNEKHYAAPLIHIDSILENINDWIVLSDVD